MADLMSLQFQTGSLFSNILSNGGSRMTLVSMEKGKVVEPHHAPIPVAVIVLTGEVNFKVDSQEYVLTPGQVLCMAPNEVHTFTAVSQTTMLVTRFADPAKLPARKAAPEEAAH